MCISSQELKRQLKSSFERYGPIDSVKLVDDKVTQESCGYAFVNFKNINDAEQAKNDSVDLVMFDREIKVEFCAPQRSHIPKPSRCLGVFGLSKSTTDEDLREMFDKYGSIDDIAVIKNKTTKEPCGYAFVYFNNLEDAKAAKKDCADLEIKRQTIKVEFSLTSQSNNPNRNIVRNFGDSNGANGVEEDWRRNRTKEKSRKVSGDSGYQSSRDDRRYGDDHERRVRGVDFRISQQAQTASSGIHMGHPSRNFGGGQGEGSSRDRNPKRSYSGSSKNIDNQSISPRHHKRYYDDYENVDYYGGG